MITMGIFLGYCSGLGFPAEENHLKNDKNDIYWRIVLFFPGIIVFLRGLFLVFVYKDNTP